MTSQTEVREYRRFKHAEHLNDCLVDHDIAQKEVVFGV
ncbi:hypothetical protein GGR41_002188 [Paenalcaligenes hominis]|uniref:Uncharacterized protein n=1 Tax=Paenalcaligenes hominis TaxID=643674 RepID=A0ABX0WT65_9BURK|nr:hypothetical protein [Paenalcaligenes hominis]